MCELYEEAAASRKIEIDIFNKIFVMPDHCVRETPKVGGRPVFTPTLAKSLPNSPFFVSLLEAASLMLWLLRVPHPTFPSITTSKGPCSSSLSEAASLTLLTSSRREPHLVSVVLQSPSSPSNVAPSTLEPSTSDLENHPGYRIYLHRSKCSRYHARCRIGSDTIHNSSE